ncbi:MAG TPA: OmpA family protein [Bryobacteraceae bacterium]|nr:OmpA family protein [Bryobacteraceae bacterium]
MRKPQYLQPARDGRERWLVSYTDILTLLLILFIAMAAQAIGLSHTRAIAGKPATVPSSSTAADPTPSPPPPAQNQALVRTADQLKQRGLDLKFEIRGLVISLPQEVLFASGDDRINPSARPMIAEIAEALRESDNNVELAGHADSVPIHNRRFKNNWELSAARGLSLLRVLTSDYGIEESRLTLASYGAYRPKGSNDTIDGRAENRRVEILILNP